MSEKPQAKGLAQAPERAPAVRRTQPFGTQLICGGCDKVLGQIHFAAPHGWLRNYACPGCGAENRWDVSGDGISRETAPRK